MIPVELKLRDFLSYREPDPIDLSRFDVACLTGENGVGKSTLLDAITWVLWGAARGCEGGRNQDRLIRDGAEETSVELTFELADEIYRVARLRNKRTARADLRFEVKNPDGWTNLARDTLRETEARIAEILRMDYATFTASAFFVQGRADDFLSRMRPEERKEVFARLLDLGAYERLCDEARQRRRDAKRRREDAAARVQSLRPQADELAKVSAELAEAVERQQRVEGGVAELEEALEELRRDLAGLEKAESAVDAERKALGELDDRIAALAEGLTAKHEEMASVDMLLAKRDDVARDLEALEKAKAEEAEARKAAEAAQDLARRRDVLQERLDALGVDLRRRQAEASTRVKELSEERDRLADVLERAKPLDEQIAHLHEDASGLGEVIERLGALREERAGLAEQVRGLGARREELTERLDLLERGAGECPVCGGSLDDEHRAELLEETQEQLAEIDRDEEKARTRLKEIDAEGGRLGKEAERLEGLKEKAAKLATERERLHAQAERLPSVTEVLVRAKAELEDLTASVEEGRFGEEIRSEITGFGEKLEEIAYEPEEHARLRARIEGLSRAAELKGKIESAAERKGVLTEELSAGEKRLAEAKAQREKRAKDLEERAANLERLPAQRRQLQDAKSCLEKARKEAASVAEVRSRLAERKGALDRVAADLRDAQEAEKQAAKEHRLHGRLVEAFGRSGIPARIIENALPELTREANDALGRLSDYEMSVVFRMEGETKSGTVKETFDVLVHHDGGVRDFQMFSGGEAFRIAFAVRLGLSKLLVRRAGARLETLVIDEGFGTQDPEGRERLVEAINLARKEFRKVLVITHLDELKEAFGTQLRVTKTPTDGSRVELLGA